ncbi:MAG: hypothetical protein H6867_08235 [Rhodospirillales bacterium]|nr:hypothetical protein [Rhodospirillales bacterium]MCB9995544.1 hypothetical protein [Rhodospirillales bacterium]
MSLERVQKSLALAILVSETSHIFCCVLPTLFSLVSLATGLGLIAAMPTGLEALHEIMHEWEAPMILLSGAIILLGWGAHYLSVKLDCHNTGCVHEPCGPKKKQAGKILKIASLLFVFNVSIYLFFHHGMEALMAH